jgi:hypothetical protein
MFPQQPQQQFRTAGADVQIFYQNSTWLKPTGVSHVYMMLIGGGGNNNGGGGTSGGSGAVTVWYGSAQNVPNNLLLTVSTGNNIATTIGYRGTSLITLLTANAANAQTAGNATTANQFASSGFYQSVAGQAGAAGTITPSSTTFLSAGTYIGQGQSNYGYLTGASSGVDGYFMLQPIIVGVGGNFSKGGIGCGAGATNIGGPGLVLIASW